VLGVWSRVKMRGNSMAGTENTELGEAAANDDGTDGSFAMTDKEKHFFLGAFTAVIYCVSLWQIGVTWWKAPIVGLLVGAMYLVGWGARWIPRGAVVLLAVGTLIWIEILPPPSSLRSMAAVATALLQK
jgi:hypothetical protein